VTEGLRKRNNGILHKLERKMRWAENLARINEKIKAYRLLVKNKKEKNLENQYIVGWIMLRRMLERSDGLIWNRFS
jgi:hypothetical protein